MPKIFVIGVGFRPLDSQADKAVRSAAVILASDRLFHIFERYAGFKKVEDRVKVLDSVEKTMAFIRSHLDKGVPGHLVLLAAGDPMFFGIGRRVVAEFGKEAVEVIPDLSSVQIAFSRIGEPWDNVFLMSLHGGPDPAKRRKLEHGLKDIPGLIIRHRRLAILTDRENTPAAVAGAILAVAHRAYLRPSALDCYVCERLGYPDERIVRGSVREIAEGSFADPNIMIILRSAP